MRVRALAAAAWALAPDAAAAQDLPPVPRILVDRAALVCVKIDLEGHVDAFVLDSTGDDARDRAVLAWVRQLQWGAAPPGGETGRNRWFPMPIAFGKATQPKPPAACSPSASRA